jgi:hypothetical protein
MRRFERFGEVKDIDEAIIIMQHRETTRLVPLDNSDLLMYLNKFGNSLLVRFERFGEVKDIDEAIM